MGDTVLDDRTRDRGGIEIRTVVLDVRASALVDELKASAAYRFHTDHWAVTEVTLTTAGGYASATIVPTNGVPPDERSFDDYFSGGPKRPQDKAAATLRSDVHDADAAVSAVIDAAERVGERKTGEP